MENLFLRLFVEVPTGADARPISSRLRDVLLTLAASVDAATVRQYWKISKYQEVTLRMQVPGEAVNALPAVLAALGTGWQELQPARQAIWDSKTASGFAKGAVGTCGGDGVTVC